MYRKAAVDRRPSEVGRPESVDDVCRRPPSKNPFMEESTVAKKKKAAKKKVAKKGTKKKGAKKKAKRKKKTTKKA